MENRTDRSPSDERRFNELGKAHIKSLAAGDLESLQSIQRELAELLKETPIADKGNDAPPRFVIK